MRAGTIIKLAKRNDPILVEYARQAEGTKGIDPVTSIIRRRKLLMQGILMNVYGCVWLIIAFISCCFSWVSGAFIFVANLASLISWAYSVILFYRVVYGSGSDAYDRDNAHSFIKAMSEMESLAGFALYAKSLLSKEQSDRRKTAWDRRKLIEATIRQLRIKAQQIVDTQSIPWRKKEAEKMKDKFDSLFGDLHYLFPELSTDYRDYFESR